MPALRHQPVRDFAGHEGIDRLMQQIDTLLTRRPSPGRRSDAGCVLEALVVEKPEIEEEEGPDWSANATSRHQRPHQPEDDALPPVHRPVQPQPIPVLPAWQPEQTLQRMGGHVGVGATGERLLQLFAERHGGDAGKARQQSLNHQCRAAVLMECWRQARGQEVLSLMHGRSLPFTARAAGRHDAQHGIARMGSDAGRIAGCVRVRSEPSAGVPPWSGRRATARRRKGKGR
jgi:hypothetical protein